MAKEHPWLILLVRYYIYNIVKIISIQKNKKIKIQPTSLVGHPYLTTFKFSYDHARQSKTFISITIDVVDIEQQ